MSGTGSVLTKTLTFSRFLARFWLKCVVTLGLFIPLAPKCRVVRKIPPNFMRYSPTFCMAIVFFG